MYTICGAVTCVSMSVRQKENLFTSCLSAFIPLLNSDWLECVGESS